MRFLLAGAMVLALVASVPAEQRVVIPVGNSPTLGPDNAPVTIFEFIDFQ